MRMLARLAVVGSIIAIIVLVGAILLNVWAAKTPSCRCDPCVCVKCECLPCGCKSQAAHDALSEKFEKIRADRTK